MKKTLALILAALLAFAALPALAEENVTVTVNGEAVYFDQPPIILDGRTLVPIRAVFEAMGCQVGYDGASQQVSIANGDELVVCRIGDANYEKYTGGALTANGVFDVVPQVINDRTLVPVRALSEAFGCDVEWKGDTQTVVINDADTVKIGVLKLVEHDALDAAERGFADAVKDSGLKVYIEERCGAGNAENCLNIANDFAADGKDLIFAVSSPAAIAAKDKGIPMVFGLSTDPVAAGIVASEAAPGGKVTGVKDVFDAARISDVIRRAVPGVQTVALVYNAEAPVMDAAEAALNAAGINTVRKPYTDAAQIAETVSSCAGQVQAIYTDAVWDDFAQAALAAKLPLICGYGQDAVENGALIGLSVNYYALGYQAGRMAVRYLGGEAASLGDMPVEIQPAGEAEITVNYETAKALGVDVRAVLGE